MFWSCLDLRTVPALISWVPSPNINVTQLAAIPGQVATFLGQTWKERRAPVLQRRLKHEVHDKHDSCVLWTRLSCVSQGHMVLFSQTIAPETTSAWARARHGCLEYWDEGQRDDLRGGIKAITGAVMSSEESLAVAEFSKAFSSTRGQII